MDKPDFTITTLRASYELRDWGIKYGQRQCLLWVCIVLTLVFMAATVWVFVSNAALPREGQLEATLIPFLASIVAFIPVVLIFAGPLRVPYPDYLRVGLLEIDAMQKEGIPSHLLSDMMQRVLQGTEAELKGQDMAQELLDRLQDSATQDPKP